MILYLSAHNRTNENFDTSAVSSAVATAFQQREKDVVTDMARACSFVNPKHLFCDASDMFNCHGASKACSRVIRDFYSGKENGASLITGASLELKIFRTFRGWFGEDVTKALAARAQPTDVIAT